jgi:glutamine amidotransferase
MTSRPVRVAVVDYGLGNLFSIKHACSHVGMTGTITSSARDIEIADAVVLPGVGAFGDAMAAIRRHDLEAPLRAVADAGTPLIGICLGMQLLLTESAEFGCHRGLGLIDGTVESLEGAGRPDLKLPHIGWSSLRPTRHHRNAVPGQTTGPPDAWAATPLGHLHAGDQMYFIHSFQARPADAATVLAWSEYGGVPFCAAMTRGNILAFQFHPERSGPLGLGIYAALASRVAGPDPLQSVGLSTGTV